jgi:hypothetical protein
VRRLAGWLGAVGAALLLAAPACSQGSGLLPSGSQLGGYTDAGAPESYNSATLYTYMDGGAEFYIKLGFSALQVRRYGRGSEVFVVELFEMKDPTAAVALYAATRRPDVEKDWDGSPASVGPAEIILAKGPYYLVCRNDDPMATNNDALVKLCSKVTRALPDREPDRERR